MTLENEAIVVNDWDKSARIWRSQLGSFRPVIKHHIAQYVLRHQLPQNSVVLDIQSGNTTDQNLPQYIVARTNKIILVDSSSQMLESGIQPLKKKFKQEKTPIPAIESYLCSFPQENLPIDTQSIDIALCIFGARYWEDQPENAIKEIARVTKSKGLIIIIDFLGTLVNIANQREFNPNFIQNLLQYYKCNTEVTDIMDSSNTPLTSLQTIMFKLGLSFMTTQNIKMQGVFGQKM